MDTTRRVPLVYKSLKLGAVYCPDVIVNGVVIVELKAVESLTAVYSAQLLTYLKLTSLPVGLLMNFNVPPLLPFCSETLHVLTAGYHEAHQAH